MTRFNAEHSTLNAQRSIQTVGRWMLDVGRFRFDEIEAHRRNGLHGQSRGGCEDIPMTAANAQRPTPNIEYRIQRSAFCIRYSAFGVERSAFSSR